MLNWFFLWMLKRFILHVINWKEIMLKLFSYLPYTWIVILIEIFTVGLDLFHIYLVEYRVIDFKRHQESRTIGWSNDNIFCICFIIWRSFRFSLITISTRPVICTQTLSPTRCSVPKLLINLYFRDRNKHILSILCPAIKHLLTRKTEIK